MGKKKTSKVRGGKQGGRGKGEGGEGRKRKQGRGKGKGKGKRGRWERGGTEGVGGSG